MPDRSPQVRTRCFRAQALHLPCPPHPMGFAMRCQLARRPGLLCSFCPSPRTFALWLPPDKPSRPCPCLRLVVIIDSCRIHVGTPTGDFHPITSRPCWAHTLRSTGRAPACVARLLRAVSIFPSAPGNTCLRTPVSSNVRQHQLSTPSLKGSSYASLRSTEASRKGLCRRSEMGCRNPGTSEKGFSCGSSGHMHELRRCVRCRPHSARADI